MTPLKRNILLLRNLKPLHTLSKSSVEPPIAMHPVVLNAEQQEAFSRAHTPPNEGRAPEAAKAAHCSPKRQRECAPAGTSKRTKPSRRPSDASLENSDALATVTSKANPTRKLFKELLVSLDLVLPDEFRSCARPNGAGLRSLGIAGRSMHDVLSDVVRAVASRRAELDRKSMLRSHGSMVLEVEMPGWNITSKSPGAELFFKGNPWGDLEGQSLTDFLQREDVEYLNAMWSGSSSASTPSTSTSPHTPSSPSSSVASCSRPSAATCAGTRGIKLMHFSGLANGSRMPKVVSKVSNQPGDDEGQISVTSFEGCGCSAFEYDPLLLEEADPVASLQDLQVHLVEAKVQMLKVPNSPRALVAMTLI